MSKRKFIPNGKHIITFVDTLNTEVNNPNPLLQRFYFSKKVQKSTPEQKNFEEGNWYWTTNPKEAHHFESSKEAAEAIMVYRKLIGEAQKEIKIINWYPLNQNDVPEADRPGYPIDFSESFKYQLNKIPDNEEFFSNEIKQDVVNSYFSNLCEDDRTGAEIYDQFVLEGKSTEELDLIIWQPFENYLDEDLREILESDYNSQMSLWKRRLKGGELC